VGPAVGHFRDELPDEVEQMIEERVEQLRADLNESDDAGGDTATEPAEAKRARVASTNHSTPYASCIFG
jgi:hypothetical protein